MTQQDDHLAYLATLVDGACDASSSFEIRRKLNLPPIVVVDGDLTEQAPEQAIRWAFTYDVGVSKKDGKWRVSVDPVFRGSDGTTDPPIISRLPQWVIDVWDQLTHLVASPFALARFHHLLFERKTGNVSEHARSAAENYLSAAQRWPIGMDRAEYLNVGFRLARAVKASDLYQHIQEQMVKDLRSIISDHQPPGILFRLLRPLTDERNAPSDINAILAAAHDAYDDPYIRDEIIALQMKRSNSPEAKIVLAQRRVQIWLDAADSSEKLIRAGHLKRALTLAQASGQRELIGRTAAALQKIRDEELGLAEFSAAYKIDEQRMLTYLAPITASGHWQEGLIVLFHAYGPATGLVDENRKRVADQAREFPLSQLLPRELIGLDGLPKFAPQSNEDKQEMQLAAQESLCLQISAPLLATALSKIAEVHGIPQESELADFFAQSPLIDDSFAQFLARSLTRYWAGDPEGAAYTIFPAVERIVRELVLAVDAGVYKSSAPRNPANILA